MYLLNGAKLLTIILFDIHYELLYLSHYSLILHYNIFTMDILQEVGLRLRTLRTAKKLSQESITDKLGLSV